MSRAESVSPILPQGVQAGGPAAPVNRNRPASCESITIPPMTTSDAAPATVTGDISRRFLFDNADIRGETVHLDQALADILATHQYAPGVQALLGEFLAAAVLLSTTLKFEGKLVLQARSEGQVPLLMAECNDQLEVRAIARGAQEATSDRFDQLLTNGHLAITMEPLSGSRYQGIVPLIQDSLAHSLDAYFQQSEQLSTRFWLAADGHRAAGLLMQQLPAQLERDPTARSQHWEHQCTLAATIQPEELLNLPAERMLYRLFHQEPVRLFEPRDVRFRCSCSRERSLNALSALSAADIQELLQEQGQVTMDCEFCNQRYEFGPRELGDLPAAGNDPILH